MISRIRRLLSGRRGQGLTEYIIMVAMIAITAIAVVTLFGQQVKNIWNAAVLQLTGKTDAKPQKVRAHEGGEKPTLGDFGVR
ncbi:MAG: hypothetical protein HYV08_16675 [Deltaproteobacteria bacterium]|nr:hypothetical protein [Deltaproteobacteria bacterium]MBI3075397.1 hypothetical protein [Deltaproteobacteria bacterium]